MKSGIMTAKNNNTLLEMSSIAKAFSDVKVLENVQFDLRAGEVHVLAGENGAGKSTLMKILGGVYTDYTGSLKVGGNKTNFKSVQDASAAGISIIHQELSLIGPLSVAENIFLGKERSRFSWLKQSEMIDYSKDVFRNLGLDIDPRQAVEEFPIGVQQMIEIAKALAFNSKIIVMDEPTSALTEPEVEKLFEIIAKLKNDGCGMVYISHKMEEIYKIADRITVLRDGRYIGTESASRLSQQELIKWMVGRELDQQFPRHTPHIGAVRLEAKELFVPGTAANPSPQVNGVSFSVRAGEILGVAGLQGSGNSELLNGIFGVYGTDAKGRIRIDGETFAPDCPANAIKRGMALLTNDRKANGLVMDMSIVENATLAALPRLSPGGWLRPGVEQNNIKKTTASLRLKATSIFQNVEALSGGNQQKVVMAKWIETNPGVLLLDEPTRGVDVGAKHEIYELMNQWTEQGIAIVLITSEMPELLAMSDRIIVMHRGQIAAEFMAEQATQEKILSAALGERNTE
jgi:ABC-type sugar transport system ATPase subunit